MPELRRALTAQAPQGLCPKCLFAGLAVPTEDGAGAAAQVPCQTPEELAPHFPQLEILECLGRGGMGVVYKARQKSLNRFVALKLLAPERVADAKFAQRFTHEAQALAALNHPSIVTIYDFGQAGGFYFLLMEFVDGVNLRQAMKAGRFTPEQALAIVPPVCEALQYAHEHGIVHRDIKPENLLLDREGRVKIADFGVAKMLGGQDGGVTAVESQPAGTPQYMAPEQKEHRRTDHRADIYSLGVVLYELLTGELPAEKLQPPSRKVQIDVRLDEIVLRALEQTPELRFQTATDFRTQVESMAIPHPVRATAPRPTASSIALAVLLLLLGILIAVVGIPMHNRAIMAAAEDHVKYIKTLQGGVTSVSTQMGEANAVAGRAASRAGNSAEREETRVQAREDQRMYEQRSVNLRVDLDRLQAALAAVGNRQVDAHPWRALSILAAGLLLALGGGGMLMHIRRRSIAGTSLPPPMPTARWPFKYASLLPLIPLLIFGIIFVKFVAEVRSPSGVTSFHVEPVEVKDNIVIVDVTTVVARGNAELRPMLHGSRLPAATEAALQDVSFAPFAGTLIKPTPNDGNPAWRILSPGRQMWRLGFALPDAALAKEAFANLRPIGPLPAKSDLTFAGTLFEVSQPGGETYRASLEVAPPFTSADPRWVEVMGHSQQDAHTVTLGWEVFASQPGLAQFSRAGSPIMVLKHQPQTELYRVTAGLELTRLDANRVLFVRRIGYHTLREEFSGNFRDLADELLRTKTMSAKTACGTTIELCQFQGKPFTVQVQSHASPLMNVSRTGVFGIGAIGVGAAILFIVAVTGIVLLVVLARKGSIAGKIVLCVVGALLLLLVIAFAVMFGVRSMSQDSEQATPIQMPEPDESSDEANAAPLEKSLPAGSPDARILGYAMDIERGGALIYSHLDSEHELAFFLGQEGSGWFHAVRSGEKSDLQSFIERSDSIVLENGGKGRGFVIHSGPRGDVDRAKSAVNVAMEPGGPVPAGELVFRTWTMWRNTEVRAIDNDTRITFADIVTPDGRRIPMSARVRPKTEAELR